METTNNSKGFNWSDFLSFKMMITLKIIQIVYVIIAALITIGGLISMFTGGDNSMLPGGPLYGILIIVFGNILWRIWCELIIVFFRMNKTLSNIDEKTKG